MKKFIYGYLVFIFVVVSTFAIIFFKDALAESVVGEPGHDFFSRYLPDYKAGEAYFDRLNGIAVQSEKEHDISVTKPKEITQAPVVSYTAQSIVREEVREVPVIVTQTSPNYPNTSLSGSDIRDASGPIINPNPSPIAYFTGSSITQSQTESSASISSQTSVSDSSFEDDEDLDIGDLFGDDGLGGDDSSLDNEFDGLF